MLKYIALLIVFFSPAMEAQPCEADIQDLDFRSFDYYRDCPAHEDDKYPPMRLPDTTDLFLGALADHRQHQAQTTAFMVGPLATEYGVVVKVPQYRYNL